MSALPYDGRKQRGVSSATSARVPLGTQAPTGRMQVGVTTAVVLQTGKSSFVLTSGIVQVPPMGNGIISPSTGLIS